MWLWRLMAKFRTNKYLVAKSSTKESGATWWQNFQKMQVAPHGGQIFNLLKWSHLVANFPTIASGVTWWLNFQLIQVVPPGGQMVVKMEWALNVWNFDLFSVTRRSRSDVSQSVSESVRHSKNRVDWCDPGEWRYLLNTLIMWLWQLMIPSDPTRRL